jgi:hypothetical protein
MKGGSDSGSWVKDTARKEMGNWETHQHEVAGVTQMPFYATT